MAQTNNTSLDGTPGAEFFDGLLQGLWGIGWCVILLPFLVLGGTLFFTFTQTGSTLFSDTQALATNGFHTFIICVTSVAIALLIAIPLGLLLARTRLPGRNGIWIVLLLMACTPLYVSTTAWISLLGSLAGWIGLSASANPVGLPVLVAAHPLWQLITCGVIMGLAYSPLATVFAAAGFAAVPHQLEEDGLLHTNIPRVFRHVTIPLAMWGIMGGALLIAVLTAGEITVTDALWVRSYAERIYRAFQLHMDLGRASVSALPLIAALMLGCLALAPVIRKLTDEPLQNLLHARRHALGAGRGPAMLFLAMLAMVYAFPLLHLTWYALQKSRATSAVAPAQTPMTTSATETKHAPLLRPWHQRLGITGTSALLAGSGATIALFLAAPCAWFLRNRNHKRLRFLIWIWILFAFALPMPLMGMALLKTWNSGVWSTLATATGVSAFGQIPALLCDTPLLVVLTYTLRALPPTLLILWAACKQIPHEQADMARLDGLRGYAFYQHFLAPLCWKSLAAAWLAGYTLAFSDVGGVIITASPGLPLFAIRFATQIHFGVYPDLARLALLPFCATLPAILLLYVILSRSTRRHA